MNWLDETEAFEMWTNAWLPDAFI